MALAATIDWNVRTGGDILNGGGFKRGASGTDRSQQTSQHATLTTASVVHSTTTQINVNGGDYTVSSADVGNVFQLTTGTATAGSYEITAVDVGNNRWTVDRSVGTAGQTTGGRMGGSLAAVTNPSGYVVAGNRIFVKSGTSYTVSSTQTFSVNGSGGLPIIIEGYTTTYGDKGAPTFTSATDSVVIFSIQGNNYRLRYVNIEATGTRAGNRGISADGNQNIIQECHVAGQFSTSYRIQTSSASAINCVAANNTAGQGFQLTGNLCVIIGCLAYGGAGGLGFYLASNQHSLIRCIASGHTGSTSDGIYVDSNIQFTLLHCVSYGNGRDGLRVTQTTALDSSCVRNCVFYGNGAYGVNSVGIDLSASVGGVVDFDYNAFGGNGTAARNGLPTGAHDVSLSGDPFVNVASNNFALNNTTGAGAACRGMGWPGSTIAGFSGYIDIGALQHQEVASAGGSRGMLTGGRL